MCPGINHAITVFDKNNKFPEIKIPDIIIDFKSEMWVTEK
ncbi:hypothetical protein HNQ03_002564 [Chryseobacterium sp. 16F]|uniref:Uncharacterized protein n=1 Tax=Frigoriflavimonas asaccharolytica TaxID=2735899 RepID=A0A8J8G8V5_9FLAO|nr:hypothetical protein [Frigoriflavimonas asaccharolytica]